MLVSDLQVNLSKSKILSVFVTKEFMTSIPVQLIFEILILLYINKEGLNECLCFPLFVMLYLIEIGFLKRNLPDFDKTRLYFDTQEE